MREFFMLKYYLAKVLINIVFIIATVSCSTPSRHDAKPIDDSLDNADAVSGDTQIGVKDGKMVVQRRVQMAEELRRLQYEVYELEDKVYGNRRYGSKGLYGVLRDCRLRLADPALGGDGELRWMETVDRVTEKEEDINVGVNNQGDLIGITEEMLLDRLDRFRRYRQILRGREDEYDERIRICENNLRNQKKVLDSEKE